MKNTYIRLDKCVAYFWYEKAPVDLAVNRVTSEKASSFLFQRIVLIKISFVSDLRIDLYLA